MTAESLASIEKLTVALAVAATALSGLLWGPSGMLAAGIGAAIACANLWITGRMARRALRRAVDGQGGGAGLFGFGLVLKMFALFGLVWGAVGVYKVAVVPFALGISALVVALVFSGVYTSSWKGAR